MNLFEKFEPLRWHRETKYPFFAIANFGKVWDVPYSGYDLEEFLKEWDREKYKNFEVYMIISEFCFFPIGKLAEFESIKRTVAWDIKRKGKENGTQKSSNSSICRS